MPQLVCNIGIDSTCIGHRRTWFGKWRVIQNPLTWILQELWISPDSGQEQARVSSWQSCVKCAVTKHQVDIYIIKHMQEVHILIFRAALRCDQLRGVQRVFQANNKEADNIPLQGWPGMWCEQEKQKWMSSLQVSEVSLCGDEEWM